MRYCRLENRGRHRPICLKTSVHGNTHKVKRSSCHLIEVLGDAQRGIVAFH